MHGEQWRRSRAFAAPFRPDKRSSHFLGPIHNVAVKARRCSSCSHAEDRSGRSCRRGRKTGFPPFARSTREPLVVAARADGLEAIEVARRASSETSSKRPRRLRARRRRASLRRCGSAEALQSSGSGRRDDVDELGVPVTGEVSRAERVLTIPRLRRPRHVGREVDGMVDVLRANDEGRAPVLAQNVTASPADRVVGAPGRSGRIVSPAGFRRERRRCDKAWARSSAETRTVANADVLDPHCSKGGSC